MSIAVKPNALAGKQIVITGEIDGYKRSEAQKILEGAGAKFEKSLNKKVNLVVLGAKPGPDKLKKIESLGIETKSWDEVIAEIKSDGGAAANGAEKEEEDDDDDEKMEDGADDGVDEDEEEEEEEKPKKAKPAPKAASAPKASKGKKAKTPVAEEEVPKSIFGSGASNGNSSVSGKTVIITGTVVGHDRKKAAALLEGAGATIAKSLNKSVELVVLGLNPGPDKLSKIEDMGIETIKWEEVANELGIPADEQKEEPLPDVKSVAAPTDISGKMLLITGAIDGHTRSSAEKLLEDHGAKFAKSLNKSVELVVLGAEPGPDKMKKISDMGIPTVKWTELASALDLPEPSEPPKKKAKKA